MSLKVRIDYRIEIKRLKAENKKLWEERSSWEKQAVQDDVKKLILRRRVYQLREALTRIVSAWEKCLPTHDIEKWIKRGARILGEDE